MLLIILIPHGWRLADRVAALSEESGECLHKKGARKALTAWNPGVRLFAPLLGAYDYALLFTPCGGKSFPAYAAALKAGALDGWA